MTGAHHQYLLFDLDGTLVDHFGAIYRCYLHAQQTLGLPRASYEKVLRTVGGSVPVTMAKLVGERLAPQATLLFEERFRDIMLEDLYLLPGARWLLEQLHAQGRCLAVFTNKSGAPSRRICEHLGIQPYLSHVIGTGDTPWRKPQPEFTRHALDLMGATPSQTCFIGDSPFDAQAAAACDLPCYLVATGSHVHATLTALTPPPEGLFHDLYALGQDVFDLTPPTQRETLDAIPRPLD